MNRRLRLVGHQRYAEFVNRSLQHNLLFNPLKTLDIQPYQVFARVQFLDYELSLVVNLDTPDSGSIGFSDY